MAFKEVIGYWAEWDLRAHVGRIWIKTEDDEVAEIEVPNPHEFSVVIDLLRNEGPHGFDRQTHQLQTTLETPGEGEVRAR